MLSATPGDTWLDYAAVFVANGFYKNITDFKNRHVIYEPFSKYPKVKAYWGERRLEAYRADILVEMPYLNHTERILNWLPCTYNQDEYVRVYKERWNIFGDRPIVDIAEMFRLMRRVVNSDPSRLDTIRQLVKAHPRLIIFYNFNYELEILLELAGEIPCYQMNGHKKDPQPTEDRWVYLVQYASGAEAWNCTTTDAMVLYSLTYSYRVFEQVQGRIDRLDTPFTNLYYYILTSDSVIDKAIKAALARKQNFNERAFIENPFEVYDEDDSLYSIIQ